MKQAKPINRHDAIVSFSKDHHFGLLLGWKIRNGSKNGVAPERISDYVIYFFDKDLEKHFKEEEDLLFTMLPASDVLRKKAEAQHLSIYQLVKKIRANKHQQSLLLQLADELENHIRFEERELFNHLQETVSAAQLDNISTRIPNNSRAIEDGWKDIFW